MRVEICINCLKQAGVCDFVPLWAVTELTIAGCSASMNDDAGIGNHT